MTGLISVYFSILVSFSFITHPLGYCVLLVGGALSLSLATVLFWGFSWYLAVFILVYVGGVYVLFLFISVHSANSYPAVGGASLPLLVMFISFWFCFVFLSDFASILNDESFFLCSSVECLSYLMLCFSLLVGFVGVSVVSGQKDSFFR